MATRLIACESDIKNYIARIITSPYTPMLNYDNLLFQVCPSLEPGYQVMMEDLILMVVTPEQEYSTEFRKELYRAIGYIVL